MLNNALWEPEQRRSESRTSVSLSPTCMGTITENRRQSKHAARRNHVTRYLVFVESPVYVEVENEVILCCLAVRPVCSAVLGSALCCGWSLAPPFGTLPAAL